MPFKGESSEDKLASVNRQILEIKKKIQLSEGQRKAYFEECDSENKKNSEIIRNLKKELRGLYYQLSTHSKVNEAVISVAKKPIKEMGALKHKSTEEAISILDYKIIDMTKKLDLIRHESKQCEEKIKRYAKEYHRLLHKKPSTKSMKLVENIENVQVCSLENQIHRVEMNMMETEHVRKKYRVIRDNLLEDSVSYESTLRSLEETIQKQASEVKRLQEISQEALNLRDATRRLLAKQETNAMNAGKARDRQLQDFRMKVEERKQELERLERRIFPAGRPLLHHDSLSSPDSTQAAEDEAARTIEEMEIAFRRLKEATGESDTENVLLRFLSQKETQSRLTYLKNITEEEKQELQKKKDLMIAELEAYKFAEVKDKEQNMDEMENIKQQILEEEKKKSTTIAKIQSITKQLQEIQKILYTFCQKLEDVDNIPIPKESKDINDIHDIIKILEGKIASILESTGIDKRSVAQLIMLKENQINGLATPIKVQHLDIWSTPSSAPKSAEQRPAGVTLVSETDEEEEIPTRTFLKKQAQVIVDAKSRRKQFTHVMRSKR